MSAFRVKRTVRQFRQAASLFERRKPLQSRRRNGGMEEFADVRSRVVVVPKGQEYLLAVHVPVGECAYCRRSQGDKYVLRQGGK